MDVHVESVGGARDHFHLHAKQLEVESARLYRGGAKAPDAEVDLLEAFEYGENEFFVMRTAAHVDPGEYIMSYGTVQDQGCRVF